MLFRVFLATLEAFPRFS